MMFFSLDGKTLEQLGLVRKEIRSMLPSRIVNISGKSMTAPEALLMINAILAGANAIGALTRQATEPAKGAITIGLKLDTSKFTEELRRLDERLDKKAGRKFPKEKIREVFGDMAGQMVKAVQAPVLPWQKELMRTMLEVNRTPAPRKQYITTAGFPGKSDWLWERMQQGVWGQLEDATPWPPLYDEDGPDFSWIKENPAVRVHHSVRLDEMRVYPAYYRKDWLAAGSCALRLETNYKEANMTENYIKNWLKENDVKVSEEGDFEAYLMVDKDDRDCKKGTTVKNNAEMRCYLKKSDAMTRDSNANCVHAYNEHLTIKQLLEPAQVLAEFRVNIKDVTYICPRDQKQKFIGTTRLSVQKIKKLDWDIKFDILDFTKKNISVKLYNDRTGKSTQHYIDHHFGGQFSKIKSKDIYKLVRDYIENDNDRVGWINTCQGCSANGGE